MFFSSSLNESQETSFLKVLWQQLLHEHILALKLLCEFYMKLKYQTITNLSAVLCGLRLLNEN